MLPNTPVSVKFAASVSYSIEFFIFQFPFKNNIRSNGSCINGICKKLGPVNRQVAKQAVHSPVGSPAKNNE